MINDHPFLFLVSATLVVFLSVYGLISLIMPFLLKRDNTDYSHVDYRYDPTLGSFNAHNVRPPISGYREVQEERTKFEMLAALNKFNYFSKK